MDSGNLTKTERSNLTTSSSGSTTIHGYVIYLKYVYLVITVIAIFGTSILLFVIITNRRRTRLPVTTSSALCVLLSADLIFLILSFACLIYQVRHKNREHLENATALSCQIFRILYWTSLTVQGYAQCVVSIERAIAIVVPLTVKRIVTKRRMFVVLLSLILLISVSQILYVLYGFTVYPGGCFRRNDRIGRILYIVNNSVFRGGIPLLVLLTCSFLIIYSFTKSHRSSVGASRSRRAQELRLGAVLLTIDLIFIISTMPHLAVMTTALIDMTLYSTLRRMLYVTTHLREMGSVVDWLVLLCLGRHVRVAFQQTICRCQRFRQPASTQATVLSTDA